MRRRGRWKGAIWQSGVLGRGCAPGAALLGLLVQDRGKGGQDVILPAVTGASNGQCPGHCPGPLEVTRMLFHELGVGIKCLGRKCAFPVSDGTGVWLHSQSSISAQAGWAGDAPP